MAAPTYSYLKERTVRLYSEYYSRLCHECRYGNTINGMALGTYEVCPSCLPIVVAYKLIEDQP